MIDFRHGYLTLFAFCITWSVQSQTSLDDFTRLQGAPKIYQALKIESPITIDGINSEKDWEKAPWSEKFVDIEGSERATPCYDTKVKMLYDDTYLYIYTKLTEPHIWGDIRQHDAIIFHNNDFEVFLKPDLYSEHYFELEINVLNTVFDLMMPKPYRFGGKAQIHWDIKGLKTAVHTEGSINDPTDQDQYWAIEMAIPFLAVKSFGSPNTPKTNSFWRINFSRVQWQHDIEESVYKRREIEGKRLPEDNWVWSPIGLIDMHYPERWGYIQFVEEYGDHHYPETHTIEQIAWNIHYLQRIHRHKHKSYAPSLEQLEGYEVHLKLVLENYSTTYLSNEASTFYTVIVQGLDGKRCYINSLGNFTYHE